MDKKEDAYEFEKLEQQLHSFLTEISELSSKKPNDPLNKFKLKFINGMLEGLNKLLGNARPFRDFKVFDVDDLPSNSDVILMLSQYTAAVFQFRKENTRRNDLDGKWHWKINGRKSVETDNPEHFKYRTK